MLKFFKSMSFIMGHPLNRDHKFRAMGRFFSWQMKSRLTRNPIVIPFINNSKLLVSRGMTGATGNIYCGLHEFEEMAFLLHLLRMNDLFIDAGANVGSYTVLAAAAIGAKCISIEPIPETFKHLLENIHLNAISDKVTALNIGLAAQEGKRRFTSDLDTMNHVVGPEEEATTGTIEVETETLNHLAAHLAPVLIKIDVEGFEEDVIKGADKVLKKESLLALILEKNRDQHHCSSNGNYLQRCLWDYGFTPYCYDPFNRALVNFEHNFKTSNNVLLLKRKNLAIIKERFSASPAFFVKRIRGEGI